MNILIIDPSASYRGIVKQLLSGNDVTLTEAVNGKEALQMLSGMTPSAISIAHELGDMNSFELLAQLKRFAHLEGTPKFLITSNMAKEFKRKAYDAGFTEIFLKSDFQNLKRAMKSLLFYATVRISAKVLYVEDTQSTADYTRYLMENAGWQVTHVKSGEEAINLLESQSFDLMVTDLILEGKISGIGLIHLIRQGRDSIRNMPILAVSGWNDLLRQVYVLKHGAGDFIAKPFHETDFLARAINLVLNKKQLDEQIASQKALHLKVYLDPVSGLNNRLFMDEFGERFIRQAIVNNQSIALCLLDIDHFKSINDSHGHAFGDEVLRQVGELVREYLHPSDVAVRYGGDEVLIMMQDCNRLQAGEKLEKLRRRVNLLQPQGIDVSVTIGAATIEKTAGCHLMELLEKGDLQCEAGQSADLKSLFEVADQSLYIAKNAGRNRICINKMAPVELA
ncbi:MAG: diguanylate cyclase [Thiotrichales bacterium]|nr:diguanylate cyclase [Thiotrichales bacterium]